MAAQVAARYPDMNAHTTTAAAANADNNNEGGGARRFLPPPGIHPNNAVFGAVQLPKPLTWQRREHMIQRRSILGLVGQLLKRNAQLVTSGNSSNATAGMDPAALAHAKTWALARKLEVLIFLNSASLMEYSNVDSLARRVQALTASIVNKKIRQQHSAEQSLSRAASPVPAAAAAAATSGPTSTPFARMTPLPSDATLPNSYATPLPFGPLGGAAGSSSSRSLLPPPQPLPGISFLMSKKRSADELQRSTAAQLLDEPPAPAKRVRRPVDLGIFLFRGPEELNRIVWSYVDGTQIMRCRAVSRQALALAPLFVTSLQLSCNAVQQALATRAWRSSGGYSHRPDFTDPDASACVLRECVNLKHLEIVSLSSGMTFGKLSMRAVDCPQRFVVTHDDHEQIVLALAQQLRLGVFPQLTRLGLTCLFTNEEADGEADVLLNTLLLGCCPQLEELCLPGNSFGDYGAAKVAQMLRARVCPQLTRLDLRRNFIGEDGIRSVCHALADGCAPHLVELCFGGNTITDSSFHHVLYAMESGQLRDLRFLGIEMNYLSLTSMEMLGRSIGKLVCPKLTQISYSDNSVDNADAKRAIATSVYHERTRRARRMQQLRDGTHTVETLSSDDEDEDDYDDDAESSDGE